MNEVSTTLLPPLLRDPTAYTLSPVPSADHAIAWKSDGSGLELRDLADASLLIRGTIPDARLSANIARLVSGKIPAANLPAPSGDGSALTNLNASNISSGTIDPARIPVLPSQVQVASSGDLTALSSGQQAQIGQGTVVTTTDGLRWVYSGSGSKTLAASYVQLSDITPDWSAVANKPAFSTVALSGSTSDLTEGTNQFFTAARTRAAVSATGSLSYNAGTGVFSLSLATVATSGSAADLSGTLNTAQLPNIDASKIASGTIDPARLPVLPSQIQIISSGDLTALTAPQQDQIGAGTVVTTTDGTRYVYSGSGSKTDGSSYIVLADITPDWSVISNKPSFATIATSGSAGDLTGNLADGRLSGNVPLKNAGNTFTATQTFSNGVAFTNCTFDSSGNLLYNTGKTFTISASAISANSASFSSQTVTGTATVGELDVPGGVSGSMQIYTWPGQGVWINFPSSGVSGIGDGGLGVNAWIAKAAGAGNWFNDSVVGSICYRAATGKSLLFGGPSASGASQVKLDANGLSTVQDIEFSTTGVGPILRSADGTRRRLMMDNSGALSTSAAL